MSTHLASTRRVWAQAINTIEADLLALPGSGNPVRLSLPPDHNRRRLHLAVIVDDCADFTLDSSVIFKMQGVEVFRLPVNLRNLGVGKENVRSPDVVIPPFQMTRRPAGTFNASADNWTELERQLPTDSLSSGWTYYDGTSTTSYDVVMPAWRLNLIADEVSWEASRFSGSVVSTYTMVAVVMGVVSERFTD